jgi:hypothetical protein
MQMAMREITLKNKFLEAAGRKQDVSAAQQKLIEVDRLMNSNRITEASKLMTELEAQYNH